MSPPDKVNVRGEPAWPDWREAAPGTRVRHTKSGMTGTFVKPSKNRHNGALIKWDKTGQFPARQSYIVAPAYDLEVIK